LDIEWLLSTLFDASLFNLRAAGNGGSFFICPISEQVVAQCGGLPTIANNMKRSRGMFAVRAHSPRPPGNYV